MKNVYTFLRCFILLLPKRNMAFILSFSAQYIKLCKKSDPNLSSCWSNTFQSLVPYLVKGIPELNFPPIEPFIIPEIKISSILLGQSSLTLTIGNLRFFGAKDLSVKDVNIDLDKLVFKFKILMPHVPLNSTYSIKGDLGIAILDSSGLAEATYGKIEIYIILLCKYLINKYYMCTILIIDKKFSE